MRDPEVVAFIAALEPTLKQQVEQIRKAIVGVSKDIHEGIKWNVPSFRTKDWFATFHLRGEGVRLILHSGAKGKKPLQDSLADPLLEWLGRDRAMITFADAKDVKAKLPALQRLIAEWIKRL
ncbi:MAG: DUF1801 domain-containing protein [Archangium sp.]|nr:DUF1801 domain-containing protein [Archangium sp.]